MSKLDILNVLNDYAIERDEKPIVRLINELIQNNQLEAYKDLFFKFISSTQFYGYIEYLPHEIKEEFLDFDSFRSASYRGENIPFYNRGQLSLLNETKENKKIFVSAPTSFGKTSLIIDLILEERDKYNNILMIIPTNSLIEELFLKFNRMILNFNLRYIVSTQPIFDKKKNNILLLTPERFLVLVEDVGVDEFDLIIMDEAYKIVDFNNISISDFVNRRSYRFRKVADMIGYSNSKVLYLSPYTYNLEDSMLKFLKKYAIRNTYRKINYVTHEIIKLEYAKDFQDIFHKKGYIKSKTVKEKISSIIHALRNDKTIVYVKSYAVAYAAVEAIESKPLCLDARYTKFISHMRENYTIKGTPTWKVVEGLEKGVGIYISPLPRYIKKEIVKLYDLGILRTLIVTTAFTEGINTDAEHLIITSLVNGPNTNKLTDLDLLNTVGRAGRFAKQSVGKVYCINKEIYNKVIEVKSDEDIKLYNENYMESTGYPRNDYEIDMIDDQYLNEDERKRKLKLETELTKYELSKEELDISLNVSNKWKLTLYKKFSSVGTEEIAEVKTNIEYLVSDEGSRTKGIEYLFNFIKKSISEIEEPFPQEIYEIKPFDRNGGFTWGRMYSLYSSYTTKVMIQKNMEYIIKKIDEVRKKIGYEKPYATFVSYAGCTDMEWLCDYIESDFTIKHDKFYTEAFKFVSSIIQYRIPFYISFFVSVFKLYLVKNNLFSEFVDELNLSDVVSVFENNNINEDYSVLIDFGISNDILLKFNEKEVKLNQLKDFESFDFLDEYEKLVISDILEFI